MVTGQVHISTAFSPGNVSWCRLNKWMSGSYNRPRPCAEETKCHYQLYKYIKNRKFNFWTGWASLRFSIRKLELLDRWVHCAVRAASLKLIQPAKRKMAATNCCRSGTSWQCLRCGQCRPMTVRTSPPYRSAEMKAVRVTDDAPCALSSAAAAFLNWR